MRRVRHLSPAGKLQLEGAWLALFLSVCFCLAGCGGAGPRLPATPNVLRDGSGSALLANLPEKYHKVEMPVIYVTDRQKYGQNGDWPLYGHGRSPYVAYGMASVGLKPMPTWDELVKASSSGEKTNWELSVFSLKEIGSVMISADSFEVRDGSLHFKPEIAAAIELEKDGFHKLLEDQLDTTPKKDIYLYIHGVANYFESPVLRAATMWHFTGRQGACVAYSWPAGKGGLFGYFYDRESGEFTVLHLKRVLKMIASTPGLERLHIICHSRGADITTTALRELNVEYMARGESAQQALKLETLVLAAPDLDAEVFSTRLMFENMAAIAKQIVIYCSDKDTAVGMADRLFHSRARLGTLSQEAIKPAGKKLLAQLPWIQIVQCNVSGFGTTHDYIFTNPGAFSDLIMVLRDGRKPGADNGRPLTSLGGAFWSLDNKYLLPSAPTATADAK